MPTIREAITEGANRLHNASTDHPRKTASSLLCHVLDIDGAKLISRANESLEDTAWDEYAELVGRRAKGEPLQYILGHQEFYGLNFKVTPAVLIPRPETEFLVEQVLDLAKNLSSHMEPLIVDVGTGSGCIAVALGVHLQQVRLIATDISEAALQVARENAVAHNVHQRIRMQQGDLLEALENCELEGAVDIIVSNPPYVPAEEIPHLQREVRDHEPRVALTGGSQGMDNYRRLLNDGPRFIPKGGYLVLEIGYRQLEKVEHLIDAADWNLVGITRDLQDFPRALTIQRV